MWITYLQGNHKGSGFGFSLIFVLWFVSHSSNTNIFVSREISHWWWNAVPFNPSISPGTSLGFTSFWVSPTLSDSNLALFWYPNPTFLRCHVGYLHWCTLDLLRVTGLLFLRHVVLLIPQRQTIFILSTGYIPKSWLCNTLSLQSNRFVLLVVLYLLITDTYIVCTQWYQISPSHLLITGT